MCYIIITLFLRSRIVSNEQLLVVYTQLVLLSKKVKDAQGM